MSMPLTPHLTDDRLGRAPVLVVDADPGVRRLIWWTLEEAGFAVETAADAFEALRQAARRRPALVIVDLGPDGGVAADIAAVLRAIHGQHLPLLLLQDPASASEGGPELGHIVTLAKPIIPQTLVAAVRRLGARPRTGPSPN